ncbi:MAG: DUF72 domain-containing protein [Candidatus Binataceae bacterium]
MARFFLGTSGWNYREWRGGFYPHDLPAREWLSWYAQHFNSTEINHSFYHFPRSESLRNWNGQTPDSFIFALKALRLITHTKRLKDIDDNWRDFTQRAQELGGKLGPILLQFPSSFRAAEENMERLEKLLASRPSGAPSLRLAVEFRHKSWLGESTIELLGRYKTALVLAHSSRYPVAELAETAPFTYFRFHGPKELSSSPYSTEELGEWGAKIRMQLERGRDVYAYFNNDNGGYAVPNARELGEIVRWNDT